MATEKFSIRQKPGKFNGVWSDMATEKSVIKDSKGCGGISGITRQKPAMMRWSLTRHVLADFTSEMKTRSGCINDKSVDHDEVKPTALIRDEEQVQKILDHVLEKMTDPFATELHPPSLINISTGMHASKDTQASLKSAVDDGNTMAKSFIDGAFCEGKVRIFFGSIPRSKLKSFEDLTKKIKLKCRTGEILNLHINPELVFRRALVLANSRDDVTVEKVLSFPIGPIPTALFHDDGTMRKSCKADLCHQLENETSYCHSLPDFDKSLTVLIRDGMALIQCINAKNLKNFGDIGTEIVQSQLRGFSKASSVVDVFDRYDVKLSIKAAERDRRSHFTAKVFQIIEGRSLPDWKKFLSSNENKQALLKFLGSFIVGYHTKNPNALVNNNELTLAGTFSDPQIVKRICDKTVKDCVDLYSTHEEADTRMSLHAIYADKQFGSGNLKGRIIVKSPDTDVIVLCVHYFSSMKNTTELWFETGTVTSTKDARRFIPIHELCNSLNSIVSQCLPAVHAISGCDTTSAMFGIGKKTVFKVLKQVCCGVSDLVNLASCDVEESVSVARKFVAMLYDQKGKFKNLHSDLNKMRVKLATTKDASLAKLPLCESTFTQHLLRASLQTSMWMSSHLPKPPIRSPLNFGWIDKDGFKPVFFEGQMSSDFLQDLVCTCKGKSVCSKECVCFEQNLSCTDLYPCQASEMCKNINTRLVNLAENEDDGDNA